MQGLMKHEMTAREVTKAVKMCMEVGLVPMVTSAPGLGKSSLVAAIADEYNLELLDVRLGNHDSVDFNGYPVYENGEAFFANFFEMFPTENDSIPEGKDGFLLFLDEFSHAPEEVIKAAHKLVLDRKIGNVPLHPNTVIVAAGNREEDRMNLTPLGSSMNSRLIHLQMKVVFDEWLYDVAIPHDYDPRIIAYLSAYPERLIDYDPVNNSKTYAVPRTWEHVNRLISHSDNDKKLDPFYIPLLSGTMTSTTVNEFYTFTEVYDQLPSLDSIVKDPLGVDIEGMLNNTKFALVTQMLQNIDDKNISAFCNFILRKEFSVNFQILFGRGALTRNPVVKTNTDFRRVAALIGKYT